MQLREPIKEYFGTAQGETLLDESVYSSQDLREDKIRLKQQRKSLSREMDEYAEEYKKLLREGAQAGELERKQLAQQAKIAKKKYRIKKQQYKKNSVVLATIVTVEGARELMEMHDDSSTNIEQVIDDREVNAEQVQEQMMDQMVQFELDMEVMQSVQESLDLDVMSTDMGVEENEEMEKMEQMAAGDISEEQLDIDDEVSVDADEAADVDLDVGDSGLGDVEEDLGI